ncbi:MAG: ATP-dependent Clp protease ATP-binding subunit [Ruminococcaceae bacterium]|nr:ATP-dependent Clp protease ATP-binding subunit [Oscillospiraceae bacterium]
MNMTMCSRCHKRVAVVFMTKIENGETKQEGICLKCARELGIKPVNDIISKMGLSDEDIEKMNSDIENFISDNGEGMLSQIMGDDLPDEFEDDETDARAPAMDFSKLVERANKEKADEEKKKGKKKKETKFLTTYCTNMTERAAMGKMDNVVGRDRELARVIQILCRRQKNNPCLIGEPGVGKTAIAEALAQKIVKGEVPYALKNKEVYLVDLTALVAGTQFRGQFESRVLGLLGEVKALGNVILVIDEVHNIVGAGDAEGSMNAANILKPALSRGEIQVIGATTLTEYRKYIEKDTALERRFQPVTVDEPSMDDTEKILRGIKHYYEEYHSITIPATVLSYAVSLSERYITDRYLPDKAIDLIDEAASHISLSSAEINEKRECMDTIKVLENERGRLEAEAEKGENTEDIYRRLAEVKSETLSLQAKVEELTPLCEKVEMKVSDLADVIEIWTGIPASSINEDEFSRLEGLSDRIKRRIVGQDKAVDAVVRAVKRGRTGISPKRKPVSFIFAGPTGVGKTELVKVLAEDLFSSPETLIRLDMSEFMDKFSVSRIIGAPPGYVGYDDAGQLTEKIRRKPYSVVLFDEIEKAHPDVMNILLQILDDGRITDAHGKQVSFENTVIVMTTNAGSMDGSLLSGFTDAPELMSEEKTHKALSTFLRPEFINRVDEVITFRSLAEEDFARIARIMISDLEKVMAEKEITLTVSEAAIDYIAKKSFSVKYGARNMRRFIETEVQDRIAEEIIRNRGKLTSVSIDADETGITAVSV